MKIKHISLFMLFVWNSDDGDLIDIWFDKYGKVIYARIESRNSKDNNNENFEPFCIYEFRSLIFKRYIRRITK